MGGRPSLAIRGLSRGAAGPILSADPNAFLWRLEGSIGFCAPSRLPNGSERGSGLPKELGKQAGGRRALAKPRPGAARDR